MDWINTGYLVLSIYLSFVLFYYYRKTAIPDFGIFGTFYAALSFFAFASLGHQLDDRFTFISSFIIEPTSFTLLNIAYYFSAISGYIFYYAINLYFARGISNTQSILLRKINFPVLILNLLLYTPLIFGKPFFVKLDFDTVIMIRYTSFMLFIALQVVILIESLKQFKSGSKHHFYSASVEKLWKSAIWVTLLSCLLFTIEYVISWIDYLKEDQLSVIDTFYILAVFAGLLGIALVMVISIFVPEALLIFRYQIVRAVNLYKGIPESGEDDLIVQKEKMADYLSKLIKVLDLKEGHD